MRNHAGGWVRRLRSATPVLDAAGAADLIVASRPGCGTPGHEQLDIADRLILESGRPVVVVPQSIRPALDGRNVVVGWSGGAAARAVFDALPILMAVDEVRVVEIRSAIGQKTTGGAGKLAPSGAARGALP